MPDKINTRIPMQIGLFIYATNYTYLHSKSQQQITKDCVRIDHDIIMKNICRLTLFILFFFLSLQTLSQGFGQNSNNKELNLNPLKIEKTLLKPNSLNPGGLSELKIIMSLPPEFHSYLDQFKVEVETPKDVFLTEFQISPIVDFKDPVSKEIKKGTRGTSELLTLVQLPSNFKSGSYNINAILTYQACTKDYCLFPNKINFSFPLKVSLPDKERSFIEKSTDKGWFIALVIIFFSGILTSFTPCIFPLIPITLAVIGSTDTKGSRLRGFFISLAYVLGIAITYSILGLITAKTGALFGSLLGSPIVVTLIASIFVAMALSMFGLYEIKIPENLTTQLMGKSWEKGLIGAFMSGLVAGIVASPCVGPVLVSLLAYVAHSQNTFQGFIFLFTFALGLGQIFLLLGTFSQLIYKLPKSGPWLEDIKFIFGLMMIAAALYLIHPVLSTYTFDIVLALVLIILGLFFGGVKKINLLKYQSPLMKITLRLFLFLGILFAVKAHAPDNIQKSLFGRTSSGIPSYPRPDWLTYSDEALEKAIQEKRPVIIDFQADWCLACKELEIKTFSDPRILKLGKNTLWLAFDATHSSEKLNLLKEKYRIQGLPMVIFYDSQGLWREDLTLNGFEEADAFLKRMQQL